MSSYFTKVRTPVTLHYWKAWLCAHWTRSLQIEHERNDRVGDRLGLIQERKRTADNAARDAGRVASYGTAAKYVTA